MGSFQYGMLVEQLATTATSGGTTTLSNTSKQIQVFTGTSSQTVKLPPTTSMSVGQFFEIYNSSTGTLTMQYQDASSFIPATTVSPSTSLIVKLASVGTTNGTWVIQASSASGSGSSKNYLTSYVASTSSSTPNSGNGNFEQGSTSGWSLANSSLTSNFPSTVGSGGNAFSSAGGVHGGSAANANLSLSVVSSNQLAGSYSASYSSSTATTAGDMIISNAFFIDIEDQAKIMQFSIAYKAQTNPTNGNFSGTSSNSFAVAIYDVTNNAWIMPAGVYNLVQNSGVGLATGTFQTTSNSTQYQIALYNANASSGAITLYLDDFFLGPQIVQKGPAMSDFQAYTPIFTNLGTVTAINIGWARIGDRLVVSGTWTNGTVSGSNPTMSLPSGLNINTTDIPTSQNQSIGYVTRSVASSTTQASVLASTSTTTSGVLFSSISAGENPLTPSQPFNNSETESIYFEVPIAGWSSNSVQSSDTDTRVVASAVGGSVGSTASGSVLIFPTVNFDTHAGYSVSTGRYTTPVSGYYSCSLYVNTSSNQKFFLYQNGVQNTSTWVASGDGGDASGTIIVKCNAGDLLDARPSATITLNPDSRMSFTRLSGPAVIAATESVNARYFSSSSSVSGSLGTVTYATKDFDSHNAYASGTYTTPVSGKYQVNSAILLSATFALNSTLIMEIQKNGSVVSRYTEYAGGVETDMKGIITDIISCNAGDTIRIQVSTSGSGPAIVSSNFDNYISLSRVGN